MSDTDEDATNDLDTILDKLGGFGRFQAVNVFLLSIIIVFNAIFSVAFVFTAGDETYRCYVEGCEEEVPRFDEPWLPDALPVRSNDSSGVVYETCSMHTRTNTTICDEDVFLPAVEVCRQWVYQDSQATILREGWDLSCEDNRWQLSLVGSVNNVGQVLGLPLAGYLSDRFGRKTTIVVSTTANALVGVSKSFSNSFYMFLGFELLDPIVGAGLYSAAFVLGLELVGPDHRVLAGALISSAFAFGEVILGSLAWVLPDWRTLLRVCYAPAFLIISYHWVVPESVRWLVTQGRTEQVMQVLKKVSAVNKTDLPEDVIEKLQQSQIGSGGKEPLSSLQTLKETFKSKIMLLRFITCAFCWVTNSFVFFGLSINSVEIAGNKYLNFILSSFIELPAYFATYLLMDRWGRKPAMIGSLLLSGLGCVGFALVPSLAWAKLVTFLVSKFAITVSFTGIYVYTTEMFPTVIRMSAMNTCSMLAHVGSIVAPQTPLLSVYYESLPVIVFGALCFLASLMSWAFPETLNTHLPDTVEEAEQISASRLKK